MTPSEIAQAKAKRAREEAVQQVNEAAARDVSQMNARGALHSSGTIGLLMKGLISSAKRLCSQLVSIYVETFGGDLDQSAASREIEAQIDILSDRFLAANGRHFQIDKAGQMLGILQQEINKVKAGVAEEVQIALFDSQRTEKATGTPHPTQVPNVGFVKSADLRSIASINAEESARCLDAGAYNAAAIMAGSAIEAVLLDLLHQHEPEATTAKAAPKRKLNEWDLSDLIEVSIELNLLHESVATLAGWVRQHRNLVHPGLILKSGRKIAREEANLAVSILGLICRELKPPQDSKSLVGRWTAKGIGKDGKDTGWEGIFEFLEDGTAKCAQKNGTVNGTWSVQAREIIVEWKTGAWDKFPLPIQPDAIHGDSWTGGKTYATKIRPHA